MPSSSRLDEGAAPTDRQRVDLYELAGEALERLVGGHVLDNGQPQPRAAHLLGVALVHPVEPLEHPLLVGGRDADARVPDRQAGSAPPPQQGGRAGSPCAGSSQPTSPTS